MGKGSWLERLGLRRRLPSLGEFRDRIAEGIMAERPDVRVERVGDDGLETYFPDATKPGFTNLDRAYRWLREQPGELEQIVSQMVRLALTEPLPATPEALVVLVRPKTFDPGGEDAGPGLVRPLVEELVAIVAVDTPESYVFSPAKSLRDDLGMEDDAIWARAVANTRALVEFETAGLERGKIGEIVSGVRLASSLLADDAVWDSPEMTASGPLVVAPFERDRIVFAALDDTEALEGLKRWHARASRTADWLCDLLIVRRNGRWEVLD